jgi:hypothetical protein
VPSAKERKPSRLKRRLLGAGIVTTALAAGAWVAIHEIPWFGPWVAEAARGVVGPGPIAWLEDVVYGAEDKVNLALKSDEKPKTFWTAPTSSAAAPPPRPGDEPPPTFTAPFENVKADGDGVWIPMRAPGDTDRVALYKALVHPDSKRPFAAVAVVAIDLKELELELVAGFDEPKSQAVTRAERPGLIPEADRAAAVAVFNGGFRAMHGNYGMKLGDKTFIPPRDIACTLAMYPDDRLDIRTWSQIKDTEPTMVGYRQTPPCLVEQGEPNPALLQEFNRNWGATVGGDTIIRRSALGLSKDKRFLYYALGDAVTAQSIGRAMQVVGAWDAAQLDVNYSYPRFMLVEHGRDGASELVEPLVPDIKYSPADYLGRPAERDFFYLKRKRPSS